MVYPGRGRDVHSRDGVYPPGTGWTIPRVYYTPMMSRYLSSLHARIPLFAACPDTSLPSMLPGLTYPPCYPG